MSHQPFEDWLLSGESLDSQQEQSLQKHLLECEQCQVLSNALNHVTELLVSADQPDPAIGFTQRWFDRLAITQEQHQIKRTWWLILSLFGAATLITIAITLLNFNSVNWAFQLSQYIANVSLFAGKINQIWQFFQSASDIFPLIIPILIVIGTGLVSLITVLCITWFSSLIKIYKPIKESVN